LPCKLPDEVPAHVDVGELGGLLLRLLVPVLADVVHAELNEVADERHRLELRHDDGGHLVRVPAGVPRGIRDAALHRGEPFGEVVHGPLRTTRRSGIT
jgi:hypothetical protein